MSTHSTSTHSTSTQSKPKPTTANRIRRPVGGVQPRAGNQATTGQSLGARRTDDSPPPVTATPTRTTGAMTLDTMMDSLDAPEPGGGPEPAEEDAVDAELAQLELTTGADSARELSVQRAAAINRFLADHPNYWPNVSARINGIKFMSRHGDGRGGGVFEYNTDRLIYMGKSPNSTPEAHLRLMLHETGHATFEEILLGYPQKGDLPVALNLKQDKGIPAAGRFWATMSDEAKSFYRAWLVLRQNGGEHLLGLNLGPTKGLSAPERQSYQASKFNEFCAESFMQYATGELEAYLLRIMPPNTDTPRPVKLAWRDAWRVLQAVADPIINQPRQ
jgi:hypothetical protein